MWARCYRNNLVEVNPEVREIKHNNQMTENPKCARYKRNDQMKKNPKSTQDTNVIINWKRILKVREIQT